jgi:hypothetical protein
MEYSSADLDKRERRCRSNDVFDGVALDSQQDLPRLGISSIKAEAERSFMLW